MNLVEYSWRLKGKAQRHTHAIKKGRDTRHLGRWTWLTLKGKQQRHTTIITTYRATNAQVTAQNQLGIIRRTHGDKQPEEFWKEDLSRLIEEKKLLGDVIVQGGYGGMSDRPSDHLYPWIDIEEEVIVGNARDDRPPPILCKATSKIPSVKNEFDRLLNEQVKQHKLFEKTKELFKKAKANKYLSELDT